MRHEIEAGHKENHVDQEHVVLPECNPALGQESARQVPVSVADLTSFNKCFGLGETQAERDDQNRRASSKPEKRSPSVGCRVDQCFCKYSS